MVVQAIALTVAILTGGTGAATSSPMDGITLGGNGGDWAVSQQQ